MSARASINVSFVTGTIIASFGAPADAEAFVNIGTVNRHRHIASLDGNMNSKNWEIDHDYAS